MLFARPQHVVIARALASMDAAFLERARCYFGGGTLIVLQNGEYRISLDVDFLCADRDGYRELRAAAVERGPAAFFGAGIETLRPFTADQYGIRALLALDGQRIRFEIVREARVELGGTQDLELGVPTLLVSDQFTEKLLANADRGLDRSVGYRDAIDLGVLVTRHGGLPPTAIAKAEGAYGEDIARKIAAVLRALGRPAERAYATSTLAMHPETLDDAVTNLRNAALGAWPDLDFAAIEADDDPPPR